MLDGEADGGSDETLFGVELVHPGTKKPNPKALAALSSAYLTD